MPKKALSQAKKPIISHDELKDITLPAFVLSLISAVVIILFSVLEFVNYLYGGYEDAVVNFGAGVFVFFILIHFCIGILALLSSIMIRKEHHCLGGSITLLSVSIIGLVLSAGFWIGPILGIIGGILGLTEHEKLIKHHLV